MTQQKNDYVFDDSDGEQAFASEYAILPRMGKVPVGSVVRMYRVGGGDFKNSMEKNEEKKAESNSGKTE